MTIESKSAKRKNLCQLVNLYIKVQEDLRQEPYNVELKKQKIELLGNIEEGKREIEMRGSYKIKPSSSYRSSNSSRSKYRTSVRGCLRY